MKALPRLCRFIEQLELKFADMLRGVSTHEREVSQVFSLCTFSGDQLLKERILLLGEQILSIKSSPVFEKLCYPENQTGWHKH